MVTPISSKQPYFPNPAIQQPIISQGALEDRFFSALYKSGIVDESSKICIENKMLPSLTQRQRQVLEKLYEQKIIGKKNAFTLREYLDFLKNKFPRQKVELVGGIVRYILTSDPEWFKNFFLKIGLQEKDFPFNDLIASFHQMPPDLDIRFINIDSDDLYRPSNVITENFDVPFSKKCIVLDERNHFAILTFGENPAIESVFINTIERDHLFSRDALALSREGQFLRQSLQGLIDLLTKRIRVADPGKVNHAGYPMALSYLSRGYTMVDPEEERALKEKFLSSQQQKKTVRTIFDNHHKGGVGFAFACNLYRSFGEDLLGYSPQDLPPLTQLKIAPHKLQTILETLALIGNPVFQKVRVKNSSGQLVLQAKISSRDYLVLDCHPLKTFEKIANEEFWQDLEGVFLDITQPADDCPLQELGFYGEALRGFCTQMKGLKHPLAKAIGSAVKRKIPPQPVQPSVVLGSLKAPAKYACQLMECQTDNLAIICARVDRLLIDGEFSQAQTIILHKDFIEQKLAFTEKLVKKIIEQGCRESRFVVWPLIIQLIELSTENSELIRIALDEYWDPKIPKALLEKIESHKEEWICASQDKLQDKLSWAETFNRYAINLHEDFWIESFKEKLQCGDSKEIEGFARKLRLKDEKAILCLIDALIMQQHADIAYVWIERLNLDAHQQKLKEWIANDSMIKKTQAMKLFKRYPETLVETIFLAKEKQGLQAACTFLIEQRVFAGMKEHAIRLAAACTDLKVKFRLIEKYIIDEIDLVESTLLGCFKQQTLVSKAYDFLQCHFSDRMQQFPQRRARLWLSAGENVKPKEFEKWLENREWFDSIFIPKTLLQERREAFDLIRKGYEASGSWTIPIWKLAVFRRDLQELQIDLTTFDKKFLVKIAESKEFYYWQQAIHILRDKGYEAQWIPIVAKFLDLYSECKFGSNEYNLFFCELEVLYCNYSPDKISADHPIETLKFFCHIGQYYRALQLIYTNLASGKQNLIICSYLENTFFPLITGKTGPYQLKANLQTLDVCLQVLLLSKRNLKRRAAVTQMLFDWFGNDPSHLRDVNGFLETIRNREEIFDIPGVCPKRLLMTTLSTIAYYELPIIEYSKVLNFCFHETLKKSNNVVTQCTKDSIVLLDAQQKIQGDKAFVWQTAADLVKVICSNTIRNIALRQDFRKLAIVNIEQLLLCNAPTVDKLMLLQEFVFSPFFHSLQEFEEYVPHCRLLYSQLVESEQAVNKKAKLCHALLPLILYVDGYIADVNYDNFKQALECIFNFRSFFQQFRFIHILNVGQLFSLKGKNRDLLNYYDRSLLRLTKEDGLHTHEVSCIFETYKIGLFQECHFSDDTGLELEVQNKNLLNSREGKKFAFDFLDRIFLLYLNTNNLWREAWHCEDFLVKYWFPFCCEAVFEKNIFTFDEYFTHIDQILEAEILSQVGKRTFAVYSFLRLSSILIDSNKFSDQQKNRRNALIKKMLEIMKKQGYVLSVRFFEKLLIEYTEILTCIPTDVNSFFKNFWAIFIGRAIEIKALDPEKYYSYVNDVIEMELRKYSCTSLGIAYYNLRVGSLTLDSGEMSEEEKKLRSQAIKKYIGFLEKVNNGQMLDFVREIRASAKNLGLLISDTCR